MTDVIAIDDLALWLRLGITEQERAAEQCVLVSVSMPVDYSKAGRTDDLADTIDYAAVAADIRALAKTERKTVEKLAEDIAAAVLRSRPLSSVTVTVRKFPLPDAKGVSLTITRARP